MGTGRVSGLPDPCILRHPPRNRQRCARAQRVHFSPFFSALSSFSHSPPSPAPKLFCYSPRRQARNEAIGPQNERLVLARERAALCALWHASPWRTVFAICRPSRCPPPPSSRSREGLHLRRLELPKEFAAHEARAHDAHRYPLHDWHSEAVSERASVRERCGFARVSGEPLTGRRKKALQCYHVPCSWYQQDLIHTCLGTVLIL